MQNDVGYVMGALVCVAMPIVAWCVCTIQAASRTHGRPLYRVHQPPRRLPCATRSLTSLRHIARSSLLQGVHHDKGRGPSGAQFRDAFSHI